MHRKCTVSASVQHDAREHNPASCLSSSPAPPLTCSLHSSVLPLPAVSIPPSSERGVARRSSQAVRLSAGIKYSRWVGVARRSTEWRGVARSGATRRGVRRCRSMLGCSRYEREGRGNGREGETDRRSLPLARRLRLSSSPRRRRSVPVAPASFLRLESRGAIPLERRQRPGGACAPRRGSGRLIVAKPDGKGKGAPPCSIPRSSSVHPTIGCRAAPLPPLATAPLPGPPRSPHSVLGITAYSIELDARRQGARQRPPASRCSTDCISVSLSF